MASSLWTPHGEHSTKEKDVEEVSRDVIITLSKMHEVAQEHRLEVRCRDCGHSFTGANNDDPGIKTLGISCKCRELRYTRG